MRGGGGIENEGSGYSAVGYNFEPPFMASHKAVLKVKRKRTAMVD